MIILPDLFTAYRKGRQEAINDNWADLKHYEDIEAQRTATDRANLSLMGDLWDFAVQRNKVANDGKRDELATSLVELGYPTQANRANISNALSGMQLGALNTHAPLVNRSISATVGANATRLLNDATGGQIRNDLMQSSFNDGSYYTAMKNAQEANLARFTDATGDYMRTHGLQVANDDLALSQINASRELLPLTTQASKQQIQQSLIGGSYDPPKLSVNNIASLDSQINNLINDYLANQAQMNELQKRQAVNAILNLEKQREWYVNEHNKQYPNHPYITPSPFSMYSGTVAKQSGQSMPSTSSGQGGQRPTQQNQPKTTPASTTPPQMLIPMPTPTVTYNVARGGQVIPQVVTQPSELNMVIPQQVTVNPDGSVTYHKNNHVAPYQPLVR